MYEADVRKSQAADDTTMELMPFMTRPVIAPPPESSSSGKGHAVPEKVRPRAWSRSSGGAALSSNVPSLDFRSGPVIHGVERPTLPRNCSETTWMEKSGDEWAAMSAASTNADKSGSVGGQSDTTYESPQNLRLAPSLGHGDGAAMSHL